MKNILPSMSDTNKRIVSIIEGILLTIWFTGVSTFLTAQERNEEVTIIAPYQPSISDAIKISFAPEIAPEERSVYQFQFDYIDRQIFAPLTLETVKPARVSTLKGPELLRNYIKAGFGNYTTPYLELFASSLQSDKFQASARLKHLSSQGKIKDYGPSAYSNNEAEVNGKLFLKQHTLSGKADYMRDVYHFYGFQPDSFPELDINKDSIRQRFQNIGAAVSLSSNYENRKKLSHRFSLDYYNFSDRFETSENMAGVDIELKKGMELFRDYPPTIISLSLGMDYISRKTGSTNSTPLLFYFRPGMDFNFGQYKLNVGFELVTSHDSNTAVNIFPVIRGEIVLIPGSLNMFVELKGEREINTFKSFANENPYVISNPETRNTISRIGFGGGIMGNVGGFNYFAKAYYRNVKDMAFFVNDTSLFLLNRFEVIYDDVNEFSVEAGGGYSIPKTMNILLSGTFFGYNLKNEIKPWHKPSLKVSLDGSYTFLEKYTVDAAVFLFGPAPYRYFQSDEMIAGELESRIDLNMGFTYQHNPNFSAFLKLNNILNQQYQLWYRYPVQGFQVMAGLGFSF